MARYDEFQPRYRRQVWSGLTAVLVALLIGLILGVVLLIWVVPLLWGPPSGPTLDPDAKPRDVEPAVGFDADEREAMAVFKEAKDSVVNVDTVFQRRRPDMKIETQQAGTGSGFAWDDDGHIITNFHVIREAVSGRLGVRVVLADRSAWPATILAVAPDYDLAVLQVDPGAKSRLKKIRVGSSKALEVGQRVYAIGNPFGYSLTLTKGIISALEREIEAPTGAVIPRAIQTQAPINPGNSGGPLLDKAGRMIGVNTQIATPSGGNVGIGFAIPADTVNEVVTQLLRTGKILKPDLGIKLVDQFRVRRWGFTRGVMIAEVDPNGPAAEIGLMGLRQDLRTGDLLAGDLIVSINTTEIRGLQDYLQAVSRLKPGEKVKIRYERGDHEEDAEITVRGI